MNIKAIGLIEVSGSVAAIDALDIMCKAASVELLTWEKKLGGRLVTVVVTGDVSDVKAAVDAANASCIVTPCASAVIASPHEETKRILLQSAKNHNIGTTAPARKSAAKATQAKKTNEKTTQNGGK